MSLGDVKGRLRGIVARGGRFVLIDPRRTETAEWASEHHFVQPGGDAALVLSLLHVLFRERRVREHAIRTKTDGLDELQRVASRFSPERVSDVVGMSATTIEKLARDFAAAPRAVAYGRVGVCQNEFGTLASWLIEALNVVTGNFDREGGAMFTTPAADLATLGRYFVTSSFGTSKSRVRGLPDVGGLLPAATLSDEIETEGPGQIRAFVTFAGNPVLSTPNGPRLSRALGKLEFMVSIDPFVNETTRHADIILPPASSLSRTHFDLLFNMLAVRNVAHFSEPIFERRADERHDWEILQELSLRVAAARSAGALGAIASRALVRRGLRVDPDRVLDLALRAGPHSRLPDGTALTLSSLRAARHGIDLGPLRAGHGRHVLRAGGRIDLAPAVCLADLPRLERWVDAGRDVGLVLIGRRHVRTNNSWMHNCSSLVKGPNRATLMMHPHDARVRSIANGDRVVLETRVGTAEATAEVTDHVMRGVVSLPHGYGHEQVTATLRVAGATTGPSANDLTDELRLDVPSATAALNGVPVTVHRAVSKAAAGG